MTKVPGETQEDHSEENKTENDGRLVRIVWKDKNGNINHGEWTNRNVAEEFIKNTSGQDPAYIEYQTEEEEK